ncbi:TniQ family protein [Acinetobacter baumannii]|uniref:TniQ family protein n=1 Tax=Acinetobacter baumannii TaxID=470 RepID=UPI002448D04A|nr:TniQ family protein [Acinetobacter baumannii]MDH2520669.1 TniQ family protein [Acinetobacter baumannii]
MNNKGLLIQPIPYEDESAASYLLRAAQLNMHSSVYTLIGKENFAYLTKQAPNCDLTDLPRFKFALQVLGINSSYQTVALERVGPTSRSPKRWGQLEINENLLLHHEFSFCPDCLNEQAYFKKIWLFRPIYACPIHSLLLLDKCHQCGETVTLAKGHITLCPSCKTDRTKAPRIFCKTAHIVHWFIRILEEENTDFFHEFTSYWTALKNFAEFQDTLSDEEYTKMTYEYFTDLPSSIKRLSTWINNRIYLAHPRIQLLPFLKEKEKFHYFCDYLKLVEEKCSRYKITSSRLEELFLSQEEVRLVLNIGRQRLKSLVADDFLKVGKNYYGHEDFKSSSIEKLLIRKNKFIDYEIFTPPKSTHKSKPIQPTISEIATKLDINFETARKLSKTHWLLGDNVSIVKVISNEKLEDFYKNYITASSLARKLEVNATNLVEKLLSINISPVSGPYVDGLPINIYEKSSVENIKQIDINSIVNYKTRTGRHKKGAKNSVRAHCYSLLEAATLLKISARAVSYLIHAGYLTRNYLDPASVKVDRISLDSLKQKIESEDYVSFEAAAEILNCSLNWLNQYWCKTGFLTIEKLVFWRLIKKSELNEVLKLKDEYITGAEASKLLGMRHSYITNLQKQQLIKPYYMGKNDKKIRLFKRKDVLKLKDLNCISD